VDPALALFPGDPAVTSRLRGRRSVSDVRVDDEGISARSRREVVLDVLFDGRRVYSFWLHRDGTPQGGRWYVPWPKTLREFLNGRATISLVAHESGDEVFRDHVSLGSGEQPIAILTRDGQPLSLDKSWRRVQTFDTATEKNLEPLMDALGRVLAAMRDAGIDGFLAYGTLLGAVREGRVLGHDWDADLGYVSRFHHPVDVIRESFGVQRALVGLGYRIVRYSALAFKVEVEGGDGVVRGLDVFGGFLMDGHLHLMGEIREPFREEWVFPLGTTVLEGREFPAPADTDRFLRATYGPAWRVPDPAFHFDPPTATVRRLNGWFRGLRKGRARWDRIYSKRRRQALPPPSSMVQWLAEREPDAQVFVDVGCGRGADVLWMADRGLECFGLDFQPRAYQVAAARVGGDERLRGRVHFWGFNLLELRQVLSVGAQVARRPAPRVLLARHLVDGLGLHARERLWRSARMMTAGDGGRLYLEFLVRKGDDGYAGRHRAQRRKPGRIAAELRAHGATIVHREVLDVTGSDAGGRAGHPSRVCRLVAQW
jgi:hypothetical protein